MSENNNLNNDNTLLENEYFSSGDSPKTDYHNNINTQINFIEFIPNGFTPKTFEEKKGIKRATNAMSISVILTLLLSFIVCLFLPISLMSLGYSLEEMLEILNEPGFNQVFQITFSVFTFTVPFIIIFKLFRFRISDLISFKLPGRKNLLSLILIGISFCSFANIAVSYANQIFEGFGINYDVDFGDNPEGIFGFFLTFIATVIVPAFVEEFAFRGIVLGSLKKYGEAFAIIVSSIMFGFMHANFEQIPFTFMVGLILGYISEKTESIWPAVLIHGYNNFISVAFNYFLSDFSIELQNIIYTILLSVSLFLGILALFITKNSKELLSLNETDTESKESKKYKWVFVSPFTIVFLVGSVLLSLTYLS